MKSTEKMKLSEHMTLGELTVTSVKGVDNVSDCD